MAELRALRVLRIKYNQLPRLPAAIARLPVLATLELSGNQITKLDSSIAKVRLCRGVRMHVGFNHGALGLEGWCASVCCIRRPPAFTFVLPRHRHACLLLHCR